MAAPPSAPLWRDPGGGRRRPQILASIGQLEFFYDQAPDVMRSCSMALQLLSVAVGSYLSGALVWAVGRYTAGLGGAPRGWLPSDLNHGRVDLFFLLLAGSPPPPLSLQCKSWDHNRVPACLCQFRRPAL